MIYHRNFTNPNIGVEDLQAAQITFTDSIEELRQADFHILSLPTPVDDANQI